MKININLEQLLRFGKKYKTLVYVLITIFFIGVMTIGAYLVLNPAQDQAAAQAGQTAIDNLNITFNHKIIQNLKEEMAPTNVSGSAGRNPFMPY